MPGDNGRIAYSRYGATGQDIISVRPDGTDPKNLTPGAADGVTPAYSPDGTLIAYAAGQRLMVMRANGKNKRKVIRLPGKSAFEPSFSPDGRRLVFTATDGLSKLWSVRLDGRRAHRITGGMYPAWSPNGRRIAYAKAVGAVFDIFTVRPDGSQVRNLTQTESASDFAPDWSPDGSKIVYGSAVGDDIDLREVVPGGADTPLLDGPQDDYDPAFSPDGSRIAYMWGGASGTESHVLTMASSGGDFQSVVHSAIDAQNAHPAWQPRP